MVYLYFVFEGEGWFKSRAGSSPNTLTYPTRLSVSANDSPSIAARLISAVGSYDAKIAKHPLS